MVKKKQSRKMIGKIVWMMLLSILLTIGKNGNSSVQAATETEENNRITGEERTVHGDVTASDLRISADSSVFRRGRSITGQEPFVTLEKSAKWTNIEEGYAELTITEQDTVAQTNRPMDYIFILDRTRTMSLNESTFEGGDGSVSYQMSNSPCINPNHYYAKSGTKYWLKDYYTGYAYENGEWHEDLPGEWELWDRHYNSMGQKIAPVYENGCQDRLNMAKHAIYELVDRVEEENVNVSDDTKKSRISFWSFGDSYREITGDKRDQGLYNYVGLTTDYKKIKQAVSEVKTYAGTYYLASLQEAYDMITTRNALESERKNIHTKVIFVSDGECGVQIDEVLDYADRIKALPNTELFTLAIGMTSDSSGTKLLERMSSGDGYTASFWQNLSFEGGSGSALAETLLNINARTTEVKAVNKVLRDQIETTYWEPIEIMEATGGIQNVNLDTKTGVLIWNLPEGAGTEYSCTVKLKLRDEYRYLISDTFYPTNRDVTGATKEIIEADPSKAGARIQYVIDGGPLQGQVREKGVITPTLKYGAVEYSGEKNWTVTGAEGERVKVQLFRTLPGKEERELVNEAVCRADSDWKFKFLVCKKQDGSQTPLIMYNEEGKQISYEVSEQKTANYKQLDAIVEKQSADSGNGGKINVQLYNEPYKIKAYLEKRDKETKAPLSGAEFTVYIWSTEKNEYLPYYGTTNENDSPYETGDIYGRRSPMTLQEIENGRYETPAWLYYTQDSLGRYRIIETKAPNGYIGDWNRDTVVQNRTEVPEKHVYDIQIQEDETNHEDRIKISNCTEAIFVNERTKGSVSFVKKDADTLQATGQGDAELEGAIYGLYAAEDIVHADGHTGVLYRKDEKIPVRFVNAENGINRYQWDPAGTDSLYVGEACEIQIGNLELGKYYLKEESAGTGYLISPVKHEFELAYEGEEKNEVQVRDLSVWEEVQKQELTFFKMTGNEHTTDLEALKGAGFSVYLISQLNNGKYTQMTDEQVVQAIVDDYRDPVTYRYELLELEKKAVIYKEGKAYQVPELESDEKGIVKSPELPYGRYMIVETKTPDNVIPIRPFVFRVESDAQDGKVSGDGLGQKVEDTKIFLDPAVKALVQVEKRDSFRQCEVKTPGAAYVIHDVDGAWFSYYTKNMTTIEKVAYKLKYQDLVVQYSQGQYWGKRENPYSTKIYSDGERSTAEVYMETPDTLPVGLYELEEVKAPDGYVLQGYEGVIAKDKAIEHGNHTFYESQKSGKWEERSQDAVRFVISSQEAVYHPEINRFVVSIKQENEPAIGKIAIYAEGDHLVAARKPKGAFPDLKTMKTLEFQYEKRPIEGAVFEIRAAEDIADPSDRDGKKLYLAGELVEILTTDAKGQAWTGCTDWEGTNIAKGLPLGSYTITQTNAGSGFALSQKNAEVRRVEITYAGQEVPVIYRDVVYDVPRQAVCIEAKKQDSDTGAELSGAVFGLYAGEDIKNADEEVVVSVGELVATAKTESDQEGKVLPAVFPETLPPAVYEIRELQAPAGYIGTDERIRVDTSYQNDQREVVSAQVCIRNNPIRLQMNPQKEQIEQIETEDDTSYIQAPQTGDSAWKTVKGLTGGVLLSIAGIGIGWWKRKKKI